MKQQLTIIKVGGKIVEDKDQLQSLLSLFKQINGAKALVHGGGRSATKMAERLGIATTMIGGRRITDEAMLDVVTMIYGGLVNKNIVAKLQAIDVNALGLTGADMNVMQAKRREPKLVKASLLGEEKDRVIDYGFVGDIEKANGEMLAQIINMGIVPIMAPLSHDKQGSLLNTNADTIAAETAKALAPFFDVRLIYCFEKAGVLRDENDESSIIEHINEKAFAELVEQGIIYSGMIPKIENALDACRNGVSAVIITKADAIADESAGTTISLV